MCEQQRENAARDSGVRKKTMRSKSSTGSLPRGESSSALHLGCCVCFARANTAIGALDREKMDMSDFMPNLRYIKGLKTRGQRVISNIKVILKLEIVEVWTRIGCCENHESTKNGTLRV
jgi:hypothetical protein